MVLSALRLLRSLSRYHYRTIILTVLLPAIGFQLIAYLDPDLGVPRPMLYLVVFLLWSVFAVLAVASMLERDRSDAAGSVDRRFGELSAQVSSMREDHDGLALDLRREVGDLEEAVRSTLSEELGVLLPPRPVSVRFKATTGSPTVSMSPTTAGGSRLARLRQWFRGAAHESWDVFYGKPDDG